MVNLRNPNFNFDEEDESQMITTGEKIEPDAIFKSSEIDTSQDLSAQIAGFSVDDQIEAIAQTSSGDAPASVKEKDPKPIGALIK